MAKSVNKVTLLGNLGADPEIRTTPTGAMVCTLNLATSDSYKDKDGNWQESTDWHRVILWDKLAEIANQYLRKGRKVYIEGRIKYRSYEKDGITRYMTEIVAQNLVLIDSQKDQERSNNYEQSDYRSKSNSPIDEHLNDIDDEVPF